MPANPSNVAIAILLGVKTICMPMPAQCRHQFPK
jgi:hypothetical protein